MDQRGILRAWEKFVEQGTVSDDLRGDVAASWKRSKTYQVAITSDMAPLMPEAEVYRHRLDNALLANCARPALDRARKFLGESISMMILTDASGVIIETEGDERAIDGGREIHLEDGGRWSEADIGTNAIGTAVALGQPVQIHGNEHFCTKVQRWTCAAAPIYHPIDNLLLGVIDISGPAKTFSPQSLALAVAMGDYIQALVAGSCKFDHERLLSHFRAKRARWMSEEIIVLDRRGTIVHSTDSSLKPVTGPPSVLTDGKDLAFLRNLPFDQWQSRLKEFMPNARTEIIQADDCELGALLVLNSKRRSAHKTIGSAPGRAADQGHDSKHAAPLGPAFVASDAKVAAIVNQVERAATRKMPILIRGETGTGKEQLARHAHAVSGRPGPFVGVNCAALPENLIGAELFGYVDGAFTGARKGGSHGLVKEADGGTLFLDEIGDMPVSLQPVMLRFLDDWTARPIGGTNSKVDILLIAATNAGIEAAIAAGRFRHDLLYRLNTVDVTLPSLAERSDFGEIVHHLLAIIDAKAAISEDAIAHLAGRPWPGNIRELRNVLARLSLVALDGRIDINSVEPGIDHSGLKPHDSSLWHLQRARVLAAHAETHGNISETARRLGISRNTVYRALGKSGGR